MVARSVLNGRSVIWRGDRWLFEDSGTPIPVNCIPDVGVEKAKERDGYVYDEELDKIEADLPHCEGPYLLAHARRLLKAARDRSSQMDSCDIGEIRELLGVDCSRDILEVVGDLGCILEAAEKVVDHYDIPAASKSPREFSLKMDALRRLILAWRHNKDLLQDQQDPTLEEYLTRAGIPFDNLHLMREDVRALVYRWHHWAFYLRNAVQAGGDLPEGSEVARRSALCARQSLSVIETLATEMLGDQLLPIFDKYTRRNVTDKAP